MSFSSSGIQARKPHRIQGSCVCSLLQSGTVPQSVLIFHDLGTLNACNFYNKNLNKHTHLNAQELALLGFISCVFALRTCLPFIFSFLFPALDSRINVSLSLRPGPIPSADNQMLRQAENINQALWPSPSWLLPAHPFSFYTWKSIFNISVPAFM